MEGSRDLVNGGGGSGIKFMTGPCSLTQHKGSRSENPDIEPEINKEVKRSKDYKKGDSKQSANQAHVTRTVQEPEDHGVDFEMGLQRENRREMSLK